MQNSEAVVYRLNMKHSWFTYVLKLTVCELMKFMQSKIMLLSICEKLPLINVFGLISYKMFCQNYGRRPGNHQVTPWTCPIAERIFILCKLLYMGNRLLQIPHTDHTRMKASCTVEALSFPDHLSLRWTWKAHFILGTSVARLIVEIPKYFMGILTQGICIFSEIVEVDCNRWISTKTVKWIRVFFSAREKNNHVDLTWLAHILKTIYVATTKVLFP